MPTIRDVASQAQVSTSTVSHVINKTRFVDPKTEERVHMAIKALGYQSNSIARSLRRGTTDTLALIVPDNSNPFFADLARAIEDAGFAEGYSVILCNSDGSEEKETAYIRKLLSKQMDGFIVIPSHSSPQQLHVLVEANVPVVVVDREVCDLPLDHVIVDNVQGGYLAGQYLIQLGHRRIGCITGLPSVKVSVDRMLGFRRALDEAGIEFTDEAISVGDFRCDSGHAAMVELLQRNLQLSAIFAINDLMAAGAIYALTSAHLRVPEDISVIGFDDILLSALMSPPITTIAQPTKELGQ